MIQKLRVNVRILFHLPLHRIVRDIRQLIPIIFCIEYPMRMVSLLPNLTCKLLANRKRISPFDQLGSLLNGLFWREQDVYVVRHDDESMQKKSRLIPIAIDCSDQQLGVGRALEDAPTFMRNGGEGIGLRM